MNSQLKDLIRQAAEFTSQHQFWGIDEVEALELLDVEGHRNDHLINPLNRNPTIPYFRPRQIPLTGEEKVFGKYLILDYCGHDTALILRDFDSIEEMKKDILSGHGILNCWNTYMFAFIDGQLSDYEVVVTTRKGSTYICDNHKEQDEDNDVLFDIDKIAKAELRWRH